MIHIFTKQSCGECAKLKERWGSRLSYGVVFHDVETVDGLAQACLHEVVELCQRTLPVIVIPDEKARAGFFGCNLWLEKEYEIGSRNETSKTVDGKESD